MKRYGNPSTPGPGLRTIVRAERVRKEREAHDQQIKRQVATLKAMAKGIR